MVFEELTVGRLGFIEGRFQNQTEDSSLFVAEKGFQGVDGWAELIVQASNRFGDISALKDIRKLFHQMLEVLLTPVFPHAAGHIMVPQMEDPEAQEGGFHRDLRGQPGAAENKPRLAVLGGLVFFSIDHVTINGADLLIILEEGTHGIVGGDFFEIGHGLLHKAIINMPPVAMNGRIALCLLQDFQKTRF